MASTGRFVTPTSRPGTTASSASPAFPAPTKASSNCPTDNSCRRMELNCVEIAFKKKIEQEFPDAARHRGPLRASDRAHGRTHRARPRPCQLRSTCERGCGYGAYFSSLSATLPAAQKTGNLTVVTDAIVERLDYDHAKRRVSGVRVIDANTRQGRSYQARVVFLCASTIGTAQILLASQLGIFPRRASRTARMRSAAISWITWWASAPSGTHPGFLDRYYYGRRPTGFYLPRYINLTEKRRRRFRARLRLPGLFGPQQLGARRSARWASAPSSSNVCATRAAGKCSSSDSAKCCRARTTA